MTGKKAQKMATTEQDIDTRNAVETAIDLSKDGVHGTWEQRVNGLSKRIRPWLCEVPAPARSRPDEE